MTLVFFMVSVAVLALSGYNFIFTTVCFMLMLLKRVVEVQMILWFGLQHLLYCSKGNRYIYIVHLTVL